VGMLTAVCLSSGRAARWKRSTLALLAFVLEMTIRLRAGAFRSNVVTLNSLPPACLLAEPACLPTSLHVLHPPAPMRLAARRPHRPK